MDMLYCALLVHLACRPVNYRRAKKACTLTRRLDGDNHLRICNAAANNSGKLKATFDIIAVPYLCSFLL